MPVAALAAWPATAGRPAFASVHGAYGRPLLVVGVGFGEAYAVTSNVPLGTGRAWTVAVYRPRPDDAPYQRTLLGPDSLDVHHGGGGFYAGQRQDVFGSTGLVYRVAAAPLWAVSLVTIVVPARRLARATADHSRRRRGLCRRCGYDRRGLPPGGPCPECGSAAAGVALG